MGSLVAAVASYAASLSQSGEWFVRIDDLDPPREQAGATERIVEALGMHGFMLRDNGAVSLPDRCRRLSTPTTAVVLQSARLARYQNALQYLSDRNLIFACSCSRKTLAADRAYPGNCESLKKSFDGNSTRCRIPTGVYSFHDGCMGHYQQNVAEELGDFIIKRRDGLWSYQLATVVDDAADQVTEVVRGADLLDNTPRQLALFQLFRTEAPAFSHIPLVTNTSGDKLSKQTKATPIDNRQALDNLLQAWKFLNQSPCDVNSINAFWHFAASEWNYETAAAAR